jgi:hypothetical protein
MGKVTTESASKALMYEFITKTNQLMLLEASTACCKKVTQALGGHNVVSFLILEYLLRIPATLF